MWSSELEEIKQRRLKKDTQLGHKRGRDIGNSIVEFLTQHKTIVFELLRSNTDVSSNDLNKRVLRDAYEEESFDMIVNNQGDSINRIATDFASLYVREKLGITCYVHLTQDYDVTEPYERLVEFTLKLR